MKSKNLKKRLILLGAFFLTLSLVLKLLPGSKKLEPSSSASVDIKIERSFEIQNSKLEGQLSSESLLTDSESQILSGQDLVVFLVFKEILKSKNDNDPRLDSQLKVLSEPLKRELLKTYQSLKKEDRSARGLIVYLIGRNIRNSNDLTFFDSVLSEPPCKSLDNCEAGSGASHGEDVHLESTNEVTLLYPEIMSLKAIERELQSGSEFSSAKMTDIQKTIQKAKVHPAAVVSNLAHKIWDQYFAPKS